MLLSLLGRHRQLHILNLVRQFLWRFNRTHHLTVNCSLAEARLKLIRGTWDLIFHPGLDNSLCEYRHGREEIGNVGALGSDESEILEVLLSHAAGAIVNYSAFCQHENLVELIVDAG